MRNAENRSERLRDATAIQSAAGPTGGALELSGEDEYNPSGRRYFGTVLGSVSDRKHFPCLVSELGAPGVQPQGPRDAVDV